MVSKGNVCSVLKVYIRISGVMVKNVHQWYWGWSKSQTSAIYSVVVKVTSEIPFTLKYHGINVPYVKHSGRSSN